MTATIATGPRGRWRSLCRFGRGLRRVALVGLSSLIGVGVVAAATIAIVFIVPWRVPEPPVLSGPSVVMASDGTELARFTTQVDRTVVPLSAMSELAVAAVVASEDASFYEHRGVDPIALVRAVVANVRTGSVQQGGSTLTQQYVKNAFVGDEVTLRRKVEEAVLSISLERRLSKDEILEAYLNAVYFGEGASGIEAAAQTYFGVPASELTLAQGATLAQVLPAPSVRNPVSDPDGARQRRDRLLRQMRELGVITPAAAREAIDSDLGVVPRRRDPGLEPFVVQHVRRLLIEAYGEEMVLTGSLEVTTTIDPTAMAALEAAVEANLPLDEDRPGVDAGAMAVDPDTGRVLAWYGGRSYDDSEFDLAMQATRRPGSTFKPLAFLAALEAGIAPTASYAAPRSYAKGQLCDPGWGPSNAGGSSYGRLPLREGLYRSVNTVFAQVGCDVGPAALTDVATRLGIRQDLAQSPQLAIGGFGSNTTVAELAQVYATLANDGMQCPLRTILRVRDRDGRSLPLPVETTPDGRLRAPTDEMLAARPGAWARDDDAGCHRMADADDVRTLTDALQVVVAETTGTRAQIGRPQAGKTGTTDEEVDAWFAGYTPDLALVVRVGDTVEEPLHGIAGFDRVQGGTIPALIWHDAAIEILADVPAHAFVPPGGLAVRIPSSRPRLTPTPTPEPTVAPTVTPTQAPTERPTPTPEPTDPGLFDPDPDPGECSFLILGCEPEEEPDGGG